MEVKKKPLAEVTDIQKSAIKLVRYFGGQVKTAAALDIEQTAVSNWVTGKNGVSWFSAKKAERLTNGEVRAIDLCPALAELETTE